jgi:hypothetical protein
MKISGVDITVNTGLHTPVVPPTGYATSAMLMGASLSSVATFANVLYAYPYIPINTFSYTQLYINVTTAVASSKARILIYSNLSGSPRAKLYESADLDCSTTGQKTVNISGSFSAGTTYWLALHANSTQTITHISSGNLVHLLVTPPNTPFISVYQNVTFASAPTTFTVSGYAQSAVPYIGIII